MDVLSPSTKCSGVLAVGNNSTETKSRGIKKHSRDQHRNLSQCVTKDIETGGCGRGRQLGAEEKGLQKDTVASKGKLEIHMGQMD